MVSSYYKRCSAVSLGKYKGHKTARYGKQCRMTAVAGGLLCRVHLAVQKPVLIGEAASVEARPIQNQRGVVGRGVA